MAKILFFQKIDYELPSYMYLSSFIKLSGHETDVIISSNPDDIVKKIIDTKPDVLGFQCYTGDQHWMSHVFSSVKEKVKFNLINLAGGIHPTAFPDVIHMEGVDAICIGEGFKPLLDLMNAIDIKGDIYHIEGMFFKKENNIIKNNYPSKLFQLNDLPLMDRELYYSKYENIRNDPFKFFFMSRGCPNKCSFCYNDTIRKLYPGQKYISFIDIDRGIEELVRVKENYPLEFVRFIDNNFIINKKWFLDFSKKYKEKVGLPYYCNISAELVDEEIVKALKESNCDYVGMGIESGNEELRDKVLNKHFTNNQVVNAVNLLKKYKVKVFTGFMLGLPHETIDTALESLYFAQKIKPDYPWAVIFQPYPGTSIADQMVKDNLLDASQFDTISCDLLSKSVVKNKDIKKIVSLQRFFDFAVCYPFFTPIVKLLIKIPDNIIFTLFHRLHYFNIFRKRMKKGLISGFWFALKTQLAMLKK